MSTHDETGHRDDAFMRAAARIGDFGNPFYDEERRRDVWNEASAVGLQLCLWLGLASATVALWVVGGDALPYVFTLLGVVGLAGIVTIGYAERLGVEFEPQHIARARMAPYLVLMTVLMAGFAKVGLEDWGRDGFVGGFHQGMVVGAVVGSVGCIAGFAVQIARARRRGGAAGRTG
jgi:hypothetical protein